MPAACLLDEINKGKNENPNQIDKVPKQAADLDLIAVTIVVSTLGRAGCNHEQINHARQHVKAVKASGHIKDAGKLGRPVKEVGKGHAHLMI
jgi:hypothetical protein